MASANRIYGCKYSSGIAAGEYRDCFGAHAEALIAVFQSKKLRIGVQ